MFGYLRPYRPELRVYDDTLFRAYYCGVCASLGKRSPLCRMLLRFDLAFLAVVRDGLTEGETDIASGFCPAKLKKMPVASGDAMDFAADVHMLLFLEKLRDDGRDNKKTMNRGAEILYRGPMKAAEKRQQTLMQAIDLMDEEQLSLERAGCKDPDAASEPFARFLGVLMAHGAEEAHIEPLNWMGRNIGRWIYLLDALDDYKQDQKSGDYNVFIQKGLSREDAVKQLEIPLALCEDQALAAWELLEPYKNDEIVRNILTQGMPRMAQMVIEERQEIDGSL